MASRMTVEDKSKNSIGWIIWVVVIGIGLLWFVSSLNSSRHVPSSLSNTSSENADSKKITKDEAFRYHWDEIKDNITGSSVIEACRDRNCYTVDAQISRGVIERIDFGNGGHLNVVGDIEYPSGLAVDTVDNGDQWEFTFDMNSSLVDSALQEWAKYNDYVVE